jgi:alpha-tubulin suppressor-like RCC1 family protein
MNDSGELGDGTFTHRRAPVKVQGVSNATLVVTGYDHSCAVLSDGGLSCWGSNAQGQLGTGTSVGSASPVPVPGLTNVTNVDVGGLPGHTCALTASHSVYCWGNASSDPSDPENAKRATPQLVSQLVAVAAGVSVGGKHSCALLTFGTVECWGDNAYGQLGNGTLLNADAPSASLNAGATLLAAGGNNTCVITPEMRVECWGSNSAGQLGNSAVQVGPGFASSGPVTVEGIESATRLSVGSAHACATLAQGTVQCWGDNRNGELGNGSTVDSTQPVSVSGIATARGIAAGGYHTCALTETGRVYCWGSNLLGQLGLGTTTGSSWLPGLVVGF